MEQENLEEQPQIENEMGSSLKKFKDVESLKNAYENLEKEFTRKSQMLAEIQKNEEKNVTNSDKTCKEPDFLENSLKIWEKEGWKNEVEDFLKVMPNASKFSTEISTIILKDKDVQNAKQPLLSAYVKFLESNFKTADEMFSDENNIEKFAKNEKVKNAVIKEYISTLKNRNYAPPVFAYSDGGGLSETKPQPPKTLEEAKELAKKIFINKGE